MKKRITAFLLSVIICATLVACHTHEDIQAPSQESTDDSATVTAPLTEESVFDNEEQDISPTPIDIDTIGGVVIVGKIGFDENGWHIAPEQPLNITYTYFLDKPSVFPGQTRIRMTDSKDDAVDKSVYLGQTVTVQGEFRFVRNDFETLYLLPYSITIGKTVEESYGDSTLKAPQEPLDLYDRSEPLPKYLDPMVRDGVYIYNAFMLSEESIQLMGNDFTVFYCDLVDAILGYRSEIPCPEKRFAELLGSVIYYDCPLFNACAEPYEYLKHYDEEAGVIRIVYKYGEEEHRALLAQFLAAGDELLKAVTPDMSDVEKAKTIYHELCTRMTYDDSALENLDRKDSYYAYLHQSGVCITFANVYNQLLTQVGIKSTIATCYYDATTSHAWSLVTLDGKDYFCDPTFEISRDHGNGYHYFGLNYADRTRDGFGKDGIRAGKYGFSHTVLSEMIATESLGK